MRQSGVHVHDLGEVVVSENKLVRDGGGNYVDEVPRPAGARFFAIVRKRGKCSPTEKLEFLRLPLRIIDPAEEKVGLGIDVPVIPNDSLVLVKVIRILEVFHDLLRVA